MASRRLGCYGSSRWGGRWPPAVEDDAAEGVTVDEVPRSRAPLPLEPKWLRRWSSGSLDWSDGAMVSHERTQNIVDMGLTTKQLRDQTSCHCLWRRHDKNRGPESS